MMQINEQCYSSAVAVDRHSSLLDVACNMRNHRVDSVVVTDRCEGQVLPVGVITDSDLAVLMLDDMARISTGTAGELVRGQVVTIDDGATVNQAIRLMNEYGVHRLPVVRCNGTLAGLLTIDDLLHLLAGEGVAIAHWPEQQVG